MAEDTMMCRLCLRLSGSLSLFDTAGEVQYSVEIMRWTSIVLSADDGLPSRICADCAALLRSASVFLARCEASDIRLRSKQPLKTETMEVQVETFYGDIKDEDEILVHQIYPDNLHSPSSDEGSHNTGCQEEDSHNKKDGSCLPVQTQQTHKGSNLAKKPKRVKRKKTRKREQKKSLFQCSECEESFKTNKALNTHVKWLHLRERGFTCETCGSSFFTNQALRRHQLIHTGVKPSQCQLCGKAFLAQSFLKHHMKNHSSERKYKCHLCEKAFKNSHALSKHINNSIKHANEKIERISCNLCGATFGHKSSLKSHLKRKHSETLVYSKSC